MIKMNQTIAASYAEAPGTGNECKHCVEFFKRFNCSARSHGECDCPKCQGYCRCGIWASNEK
jgi:hypothetical protein